MKRSHIILLVLCAVFAALLITSQLSSQSYYSDFETARKSGDKVHVVARWVNREDAHYDANNDVFSFELQDTLNHTAKVIYHDPKPPSLESAEKLVVEGKMNGDYFEAEHIFLKCPSKYEDKKLEGEAPAGHPASVPQH